MTMMPARTSGYAAPATLTTKPLNLTVLALVLETTEPELHTPGRLPGETLEQFAARRAAAADIVDDILTELAADELEGSAA